MEIERNQTIPGSLASSIFSGLSTDEARQAIDKFFDTIRRDVDYSLVYWQFLYYLLTDKTFMIGVADSRLKDVWDKATQMICSIATGFDIVANINNEHTARQLLPIAKTLATQTPHGSIAQTAAFTVESVCQAILTNDTNKSMADIVHNSAFISATWAAAEVWKSRMSNIATIANPPITAWCLDNASVAEDVVADAKAVSNKAFDTAYAIAYVKMADKLIEIVKLTNKKGTRQ